LIIHVLHNNKRYTTETASAQSCPDSQDREPGSTPNSTRAVSTDNYALLAEKTTTRGILRGLIVYDRDEWVLVIG
jgi:hypothetical protein